MTIHHFSSILIVDDSGAVRSVVRKLLTQLGFKNLDEASDGEVALAKISENHFGLVISDWNMEPMSGQVLLENVRSNKQHAYLPFIMMTADPSIEKVVKAKLCADVGLDECLPWTGYPKGPKDFPVTRDDHPPLPDKVARLLELIEPSRTH